MNAIEFLKKFGWERAENILSCPPKIHQSYFLYWCNECGHGGSSEDIPVFPFNKDIISCPKCHSENLEDSESVFKDLKRLVDSWELVNKSFEGLEGAREFVKHREFNIERGLYFKCTLDGIKKNVEKVKQAIADVESVGGDREFKVGDLVVSTWGLEKRVLKIVLKPKFKNGILYLTLLIDGVKRECLAQWWRQATNEEIAMGFRS